MIPHFTLQRGKMEYLIIRMGDEFHIIDCDEALTKEKKRAILESGCTPAQMQQMGLSGMTIPKSDIQALTVTGCGFQDDVIFYLNKKKLAFWFPQAYEQKKVDDFFRGIPRKMVKTRRRLKGGKGTDWRGREQTPDLYRKLRPIGWVWNILCIGMVAWPVAVRRFYIRWYGWVLLGMLMIALFLDIFLAEYFTIIPPAKRRYGGNSGRAKTRAINLSYGGFAVMLPFLFVCLNGYHLFSWLQVLPGTLILSAVAGAVLFLFCREFQETPSEGIAVLILVLFFNFVAFVPHFNHALGPDVTLVVASVIDKHNSGGKDTNYYCTVLLPDGRELDVQVNKTEYEDYESGDTMDLQIGTGFFGIEYAIDG